MGVYIFFGVSFQPPTDKYRCWQGTRAIGTGCCSHSTHKMQVAASTQGAEHQQRWACARTCELSALHVHGLNAQLLAGSDPQVLLTSLALLACDSGKTS